MKHYNFDDELIKSDFYPIQEMNTKTYINDAFFIFYQNVLEGKYEKLHDYYRRQVIKHKRKEVTERKKVALIKKQIPSLRNNNFHYYAHTLVKIYDYIKGCQASFPYKISSYPDIAEYVRIRDLKRKLKYKGNKHLRKVQ